MTITDYFKNYKGYSKFPFSISTKNSDTIDDFYNDNVLRFYSDQRIIDNIIAWHNMLVKYADNDKNIFWVRQYESGGANSNDNRRASLVEFDDGFKILYVSNFDAQEILNMAISDVNPDLNEFKNLLDNHDYYFHYSTGCVENETCSYPNRLNARSFGVLTQANYYLAHIRSVNDVPYLVNGDSYDTRAKSKVNPELHDKLYPKGSVSDYNVGSPTNEKCRVYKPGWKLNSDEKSIIKAHFLRFIDPLNYFPIPGESNHIYEYNNPSPSYKNIGEFPLLISYMYEKMKNIFKGVDFNDFDLKTCFDKNCLPTNAPDTKVNVAVRAPKSYSALHSTTRSAIAKKCKASTPKLRKLKINRGFIPVNLIEFKEKLIVSKSATIEITYSDGTKKTEKWEANRFNESSDLKKNISSRISKRPDKDKISKIVFIVK